MAKSKIKTACERLAVLSDTLEKISTFNDTPLIEEDAELMKNDTCELAYEIDYEDDLTKVRLTPIEDIRKRYDEEKKAYFLELQKELGECNVILEQTMEEMGYTVQDYADESNKPQEHLYSIEEDEMVLVLKDLKIIYDDFKKFC